jgi:hypothetical protein
MNITPLGKEWFRFPKSAGKIDEITETNLTRKGSGKSRAFFLLKFMTSEVGPTSEIFGGKRVPNAYYYSWFRWFLGLNSQFSLDLSIKFVFLVVFSPEAEGIYITKL